MDNNEYLRINKYYTEITEKYDVCNFDENELIIDKTKALAFQNNNYLIEVWWNNMPLTIPFECDEVLFENYVENLYVINIHKIENSTNPSNEFNAICELNKDHPREINQKILLQDWEEYKKIYPAEFRKNNKRKGKEIISNIPNKKIESFNKNKLQIVDLTEGDENENVFKKFDFNELVKYAQNQLDICNQAINGFENHKKLFFEREKLSSFETFDERIKRIENFIQIAKHSNNIMIEQEKKLMDIINELTKC
uniref:Uncharacterized protein n=1 Tax=Meloidogyne hapla TaxID=6305 RepID=A0A1I8B276_MELHA